jgi:hypothetical protein
VKWPEEWLPKSEPRSYRKVMADVAYYSGEFQEFAQGKFW